jgi:hypothetical protein
LTVEIRSLELKKTNPFSSSLREVVAMQFKNKILGKFATVSRSFSPKFSKFDKIQSFEAVQLQLQRKISKSFRELLKAPESIKLSSTITSNASVFVQISTNLQVIMKSILI